MGIQQQASDGCIRGNRLRAAPEETNILTLFITLIYLLTASITHIVLAYSLGGVVWEHSVKTPNTDYCYFHMEILYVDIYKLVTYSMNIL